MWKTLRVFYWFCFKKKAVFVLFILALVLSGIVNNLLPFAIKNLIELIEAGSTGELTKSLIIYTGVLFAGLFSSVFSWHMGDHIIIDAAESARKKVFAYIQDLDFAYHISKSTGSLISAIKRGDGAFFSLFFSIHQRIIEVVIGFLVMFVTFSTISPIIGVVALISFLLSIVVCSFVIRYNLKTRNRHNKAEDDVSAVIVDNLIGFETVKLFARENWERRRLDKEFRNWNKSVWAYQNSFRVYDISIGVVLNLCTFVILLLAVQLVEAGTFSLGDFVLVISFTNLFFPRVWELISAIREIAKNYSDIQKYFEILDNEIQVKDPVNPVALANISGQISFENVSFKYNKTKNKSIKNFDLDIKPGESVALVGRSGAGKTTIVKLLMRFYDVDQGSIKIDGVDIKNMAKEQLRSFIGVVPQEPILFNNTLAYNIAYGADNPKMEEIKAAAKLANIDSFIETLSEKYEANVGERGIKLSGGQKQRIAIARMILSNPKVVIFDEATSHLDSESEKLIQDAFWKAAKNKTTLIIAHRLSTIMRADKIVVIDRGRIAEVGTHKELLSKKESLYKYLWNLQVKLD